MRLVIIALMWALGVLLGAALGALVWLVACGLFLLALLIVIRDRRYRLIFVALLAFGLGGLRQSFTPTTSAIAAYNDGIGLTIEGVVVADPDIRDDRTQLRVATEILISGGTVEESSGMVLVRADRRTDIRYGDRVQATGLLITPGEFDTFSYADYLARRGVFSIMDDASVTVLSDNHASPIYRAIYDLRRNVRETIGRYLPEPQAGLLTGILIGNERGIAPELDEDFQAVGASHVIAISGFNMVIIAGVVMGLLHRAGVRGWWAVGIGVGVIAVYTIFAGANAAVVRAAVMSAMLYIAEGLKRRTYVPASLAFVALLMSLFNPNVLWDISFQLSFFATLGLALFTDPMQRRFDALLRRLFPRPTAETVAGFLSEPLIVTLAALVLTLPLTVVYFGRLSLLVVPVNLLIVPVQSYLLVMGGLATIMTFVLPPVAQVLYWVDMVLLSWTIGVVRRLADLPFAETGLFIRGYWVTLYFIVIVGVALLGAAQPSWWLRLGRFVRSRVVVSTILVSGVALVVLMVALARSRPDGRLHVWFLDVGHSNAVLIQTPGGAQMLVDGGRFPSRLLTSIGDRIPFTDRQIDALFITQPDENEISALVPLLERYEVGVAITNGQPNQSEVFIDLMASLAETEVVAAGAGYTLQTSDGLQVEVLHPQRNLTLEDSIAANPLVLRLTYNDISFLLTSNLNADGQVALLEGDQWPLATVMQLPAHGSELDEGFLAAAQPSVVVVQADEANRFDHPDPDVIALLDDNTPLYRTDEGGVVHFWTDGSELWVLQEE